MENFERAKSLLIGAVDTVIELAQQSSTITTPSRPGQQAGMPSCSGASLLPRVPDPPQSSEPGPSRGASITRHGSRVITEHKKIFDFKPSKTSKLLKSAKTKKSKSKAVGRALWKRECICLRETDQTWKPSGEEKIKLAKMGLGMKEINFLSDGDEDHVHDAVLSAFPALSECGGYTLLRLGGGSKGLIEIEGPDGGITVSYLKHILNQAKLYIRPLQCDISEDIKASDSLVSFCVLGSVCACACMHHKEFPKICTFAKFKNIKNQ